MEVNPPPPPPTYSRSLNKSVPILLQFNRFIDYDRSLSCMNNLEDGKSSREKVVSEKVAQE